MVNVRAFVEQNIAHKEKALKEYTQSLYIEQDQIKKMALFAGIRFTEVFLDKLRELLSLITKEEFEKATHDAIEKKRQYFAEKVALQHQYFPTRKVTDSSVPRSETGLL